MSTVYAMAAKQSVIVGYRTGCGKQRGVATAREEGVSLEAASGGERLAKAKRKLKQNMKEGGRSIK